jgi:hypothetical protein
MEPDGSQTIRGGPPIRQKFSAHLLTTKFLLKLTAHELA